MRRSRSSARSSSRCSRLRSCAARAPTNGVASSHREAPLISEDPTADNTDVYAFVSPDRPDTVTIVANYIPLEEPAGGPNFNAFADDVLYELKVDNNGDGREDVVLPVRVRDADSERNTFLYNTGPIDSLSDPTGTGLRRTRSLGSRRARATVLGRNLPTPPVNIGPRSTPNYGSLMQAAVRQLPGGIKVFAGQSDDPFFVDLGSVFDLAGLRPFNPAHIIPLDAENGVDGVGGFNTHAIVLQVPITQLTRDGKLHAADERKAVIGVYATASRQKVQVIDANGRRRHERRLGAGLAPRRAADQRGRDPAAARRTAGTRPTRRTTRTSRRTTRARR